MANTKVWVGYTDAERYSDKFSVVFCGEFGDDDLAELDGWLEDGSYFVPQDVGLDPSSLFLDDPDVNPVWHELYVWETELTDASPTDPRTCSEFMRDVEAASRVGWPTAYKAALDESLWGLLERVRSSDPHRFSDVYLGDVLDALREVLASGKVADLVCAEVVGRLEAKRAFGDLDVTSGSA